MRAAGVVAPFSGIARFGWQSAHARPLREHAINALPRQVALEITSVTGELLQIDNRIMAGDRSSQEISSKFGTRSMIR